MTAAVAVAEAETERTRETSPRTNEEGAGGGAGAKGGSGGESRGEREEIRKWSKGEEKKNELPGCRANYRENRGWDGEGEAAP